MGGPAFSILIPTADPDRSSFTAAIASVTSQIFCRWEVVVCDSGSRTNVVVEVLDASGIPDTKLRYIRLEHNVGIGAATDIALRAASGSWISFLDHDDLLSPDALLRVANLIDRQPWLRFVYSDEDKIDEAGRRFWPHFKPDWNEDQLLSTNYITHLVACERGVALACGGVRTGFDGAQDWDFALRATERLQPREIGHIPYVLYHWRSSAQSTAGDIDAKPGVREAQRRVLESTLLRRQIKARVESTQWTWRSIRALPKLPAVSLIIPTRDQADLLRICVAAVRSNTDYPDVEIIIVDNGSSQPDARALLDEMQKWPDVRVLDAPGKFNFAELCNRGAVEARGDLIVLLNNDVEPLHPDWLLELASQASRPDVGAVGALLRYPDGRLQHVGIILGINGTTHHAFRGYPADWPGINGRLRAVQEVSAVTGACLTVRRDRYLAVGGCNEAFAISHNDVDLCLRLAERGWKTIWTPFSELTHHESASRGFSYDPEQEEVLARESALFRERWRDRVDTDPFYNPNLAAQGVAFSLAFPPRLPDV